MSIQSFYNTTAILETFSFVTDEYGQEVKTWSVSTTIIGAKQGRSGTEGIVNTQERINRSEIFYCDPVDIDENGRLVFSTRAYNFTGNATSTGALTGGSGSLYFCSEAFSTYAQYDYAINVDSTYIISDMVTNNILYINDQLRNRHMQIDLDIGTRNRT